MQWRLAAVAAFIILFGLGAAQAQEPAAADDPVGRQARVELEIPPGARAGPNFDVDQATRAWIDTMSAEERARSDAYFEGGYWIQLWGFLYGLGVAALLLFSGLSAWLRDRTRRTRWNALNAGLYGAAYMVVTTVLVLPWGLYTGWYREHAYGLSNLSLGEWFAQWGIGLGVWVVLGLLALWALYAVFARAQRAWWMWGTGVGVLLLAVGFMIAPVFIMPLFNDYEPLPDGPIRSEILSLARANAVPADNVYWFDASKQHTRISANVAGFGPTTRIALNDNLLTRSSREGIEAVMGHEMGHYALNHGMKFLWQSSVILFFGFAFTAWAFRRLQSRYGERWDVRGIDDPAGWPLVVALLSVYLFALTPVLNSMVRTAEMESDLYGLNAARQPDGFAATAMKLSSYRKIEPHWLEELIFYDHPSGYTRVHTAMQWKAENLVLYTASQGEGGG